MSVLPDPAYLSRGNALLEPYPSGQPRYNWPKIRDRYVEGFIDASGNRDYPSLEQVAIWGGPHYDVVRVRSAKEGWTGLRKAFQAEVEAERHRQRVQQLARSAENLDGSVLEVAEAGIELVQLRIDEMKEDAETNRGTGRTHPSVDVRELEAIARAADTFHKIGLRAIGTPETTRLEVTGAHGQSLDITTSLRRDDPKRLTGVLQVLRDAGIEGVFDADSTELEGGEVGDEEEDEAPG